MDVRLLISRLLCAAVLCLPLSCHKDAADPVPPTPPVGPTVPDETPLEIQEVFVNESQIGVRWSGNGFSDVAEDASGRYQAALYEHRGDRQVFRWAWDIAPDGGAGRVYRWTGSETKRLFQPGLVFSGLTPKTGYTVRVSDGQRTASRTFTTEPSRVVSPGSFPAGAATEGAIILCEDFSEILYGGNAPYTLPGYTSPDAATQASMLLPAGESAADSGEGLFLCPADRHLSLYDQMEPWVQSSRLKNWLCYVQQTDGTAYRKTICGSAGVLKLGANSLSGSIVSPPLSCLAETATLRVSFDVAPYLSWSSPDGAPQPDGQVFTVEVFPAMVVKKETWWIDSSLPGNAPVASVEVPYSIQTGGMQRCTVLVRDVPPGARLGFGPKRMNRAGSNQSRCYLDNVCVELLRYGATEAPFVDTHIAGVALLAENNAVGQVRDAETGAGIPGVPVTDGYHYYKTDAQGVYQFKAHPQSRLVYISLPSEYEIPLDTLYRTPLFYSTRPLDLSRQNRHDFVLKRLASVPKRFRMVMVGDPQPSSPAQANRYRSETIPDIAAYLGAQTDGIENAFAMTLGDIVSDRPHMLSDLKAIMRAMEISGRSVPFFQTIGNHDHNAEVTSSDYDAVQNFIDHFGPTDYSFNRGDAHIISMDDVVAYSSSGSSWSYNAGFSDEQAAWLKEDLAAVPDKADKIVFLCCHIPFRQGASSGGSSVNLSRHYADVLSALTAFREAHLMIGHTHYSQNYIHSSYLCQGGQPIYEHIHQAACGAWWGANTSTSGAPNGYNVYEVDGATVRDWVNKGTGRDASYQLRVYDGDVTWTGTKGYVYNWYTPACYGGADNLRAYGLETLRNCFIAEVWDEDDGWTEVSLWRDGVKVGNFTHVPYGTCTNMPLASFWFNEKNKNSTHYTHRAYSHLWYFKPEGHLPSGMNGWEVRVRRTIPSSGIVHLWKCNRFTDDYSEF